MHSATESPPLQAHFNALKIAPPSSCLSRQAIAQEPTQPTWQGCARSPQHWKNTTTRRTAIAVAAGGRAATEVLHEARERQKQEL
jgi:hypothetical protein